MKVTVGERLPAANALLSWRVPLRASNWNWLQVRQAVVTMLDAWVAVAPAEPLFDELVDAMANPKVRDAIGGTCRPRMASSQARPRLAWAASGVSSRRPAASQVVGEGMQQALAWMTSAVEAGRTGSEVLPHVAR